VSKSDCTERARPYDCKHVLAMAPEGGAVCVKCAETVSSERLFSGCADLGDGWIPVTERLPPHDTTVLVFECIMGEVDVGWYEGGWSCAQFGSPDVTHWRPLPEPPR